MALTTDALTERILRVIENSAMTQGQVAHAIGIDPSALSKALSGKRHFKPLEIARIAELLDVPVQDLYADEDAKVRPVSVAARVQPDCNQAVSQAVHRAQEILELDQLLSELGLPAQPAQKFYRPRGGRPYEQGERMADSLRRDLGMGTIPLPGEMSILVTDLEDKLNVDVAIEPLPRGLDGLTIIRRPFCLIMVSSSIPAHRQRYTLFHEVGHLLANDGWDIIDEDITIAQTPVEARANAFAAAFLMPADDLRIAFSGSADLSEQLIGEMLGRYRVSLDALAFRLYNVGLIDSTQRNAVRRMSSARIALRHGRASDLQARGDRRWPGRLLDRAIRAYADGRISIRPIGRLTGVDPDSLLEELAPPKLAPEVLSEGSDKDDTLVPML